VLPASAANIQCRGDAERVLQPDRGACTLFEMSVDDLNSFLAQLSINSRAAPAKQGAGDPCANGWDVWPREARTWVPGNEVHGGFKPTWQGQVVPSEMLSCDSPTGDWLHVEIWKLTNGSKLVVKLYTDWN